ncbi:menaquinone-dependent protoporphyrinogen IX dehydrogenase [Oceanimonas baumannii]|uniref:menaquinone-dependent protoporphyrinogen IX dehydrogenase n=1 Tax=Oceanimonas baumannii TaxID=129578 RepID=UPI001D17E320|nr:menaquinone-dependent protoporphyrinogen IX dehydrogenase [Oceanimonas baumannii]MCC4264424.1 menaquinone-dependent protoporphyrinogen IX dehydrogenase [Oceanimonas baumannii]
MEKLLVLYSSRNGQTHKIIEAMRNEFSGYEVELVDLHTSPKKNLSKYDKVLIGASIRYGRFHDSVYNFIHHHSEQLAVADSAFFCVCLTARKPEKAVPGNNAYIKKFLARSSWRPRTIGVFAGALQYSEYNWWQTRIIQLIMKITGGSTDTSRDLEFTDWDKVIEFAKKVARRS